VAPTVVWHFSVPSKRLTFSGDAADRFVCLKKARQGILPSRERISQTSAALRTVFQCDYSRGRRRDMNGHTRFAHSTYSFGGALQRRLRLALISAYLRLPFVPAQLALEGKR
jgi:hypothetical protein